MPLCCNCFREKENDGPCPFCGWDGADQAQKYPRALRPGSILNGRYIVGRVLGQGGFGITYLAQDYQSKERVAIKEYFPTEFVARATDATTVLLDSNNRREDFDYGKAQFLEEARTLAAVTGAANILRIYSYFEENGTAYFAMEYIEGQPLDEYIKRLGRCLTVGEAERLFLPLMSALEGIHKKGIVHRDISPDNIIVTKDGTAKLIDFGAARYSTGEKSKSLDVILKHGFAPMEHYTRRGRQGPWTDVYALAATYYYAITGKVPPDAIDRIAEDTMEKPGDLGVNLGAGTEAVLLKALAVQAADRWQNMGEFRGALQAAAMTGTAPQSAYPARKKTQPMEASGQETGKPVGPAEEKEATAKKSKLPLILAAVLVLALVIFGVTRFTGEKSEIPAVTKAPVSTLLFGSEAENSFEGEYILFAFFYDGYTADAAEAGITSLLRLEADGTGKMTFDDDSEEITSWVKDGETITITLAEGEITSATLDKGILSLNIYNDGSMILYYAQEGTDTSSIKTVSLADINSQESLSEVGGQNSFIDYNQRNTLELVRTGNNSYRMAEQGEPADKSINWDTNEESFYDPEADCWVWYNTNVDQPVWQYWYMGISSEFGEYGWMEHDQDGWWVEASYANWIKLPAQYDSTRLWYIN